MGDIADCDPLGAERFQRALSLPAEPEPEPLLIFSSVEQCGAVGVGGGSCAG